MQWALIGDESHSGVTIHYLDDGMDTGAIVAQAVAPIAEEDTWVSLRDKIQLATDELFRSSLAEIVQCLPAGVPQDNSNATKNVRLNADAPRLSLASMTDREIFNWIRAQVAPLSGAYVQRGEQRRHIDRYVPMLDIPKLRQELAEWLKQEK